MNEKQYNDIESNLGIRICKMQGHDLGDSTPEFLGDGNFATSIIGKCRKCECEITFLFEPAYFLYEVRIDGFRENEPLYTYECGNPDNNVYDEDGNIVNTISYDHNVTGIMKELNPHD